MLLLYFWPQISRFPLAVQTLQCFGRLIVYIVPCVMALLPIRFLTGVPSFVFRKMLHVVAFTCFVVMMLAAGGWQAAALTSVIIAVLVYPLLSLFENESWYGKLFVQKSPGEVKRSLLMVFFMFAAVIAVSWGVFHDPNAAAAALVGGVILCVCSGSFAGITILRVLLMALAGMAAELLSPSEWDTVTVPVTMLSVALVLL